MNLKRKKKKCTLYTHITLIVVSPRLQSDDRVGPKISMLIPITFLERERERVKMENETNEISVWNVHEILDPMIQG